MESVDAASATSMSPTFMLSWNAASLYGNRYSAIGAGITVHIADFRVENRTIQEIFRDEFGSERIAGHENGFGDLSLFGSDMQ